MAVAALNRYNVATLGSSWLNRVPGVGGQMIFGNEAWKSPAEQHGSDQASEYNEGGESGNHRLLINVQ